MESSSRLPYDGPELRGQAQRFRQADRSGQAGTQEARLIAPIRAVWLAALLALLLIPFFLVDVPPVLDYPNHLARWFVLARADDPILSRFYVSNWHIAPNIGFDPLGVLLVKLLPVHVAGRIILALAMLAPVLGSLVYSRAAFGKWTAWSLGVTLIGFNGVFFLGFANFLLATGLAFAAAGAWLALRRHGQDGAAAAMAASASALIFLCHIFGVALFALLIGCQEIARARENGAGLPRAAVLVALALVPAAALYLLSPLSGGDAMIAGWDGKHKLWNLFVPFMTYSKGLTLVTGFAVLAVLVLSWRHAAFAPGTRIALLVLLPLYVAAPVTLKGGTLVDLRLVLMMGLLAFSGIQPPVKPLSERWLMIGIAALLALRSLYIGAAWADHRKDLADLRAAIAKVEPGMRVMTAYGRNQAADEAPERMLPDVQPMDLHLAALLVIERRAFWPNLFADPVQQPVIVQPAYASLAGMLYEPLPWALLKGPPTPALLEIAPYARNWRTDFDAVLLIDRPADLALPPGLTPLYTGHYAALYKTPR